MFVKLTKNKIFKDSNNLFLKWEFEVSIHLLKKYVLNV